MIVDYKVLRNKAIQTATYSNYPEIAEDFAQYALEKILQGRKAPLKHLLIDFLREEYGKHRKGDEFMQLKHAERKSYSEVADWSLIIEEDKSDADFYNLIIKLDANDRAILILSHKWGLSLKEIGDCFGVSEGRICQKMADINQKLKKRLTQ